MWDRRELKTRGKELLRNHFLQAVLVCFIVAFVTGEYGDSLMTVHYYDDTKEVDTVETTNVAPSNDTRVIGELADQLKGKQGTEEYQEEQSISNPHGTKAVVPNSRGIFAKVYHNANTDGSLLLGIAHTLIPLIGQSELLQVAMSLLGVLLTFSWWFFVQNVLLVGEKRYYLERLHYTEVSFRTLYLPVRVGKLLNTAAVMAYKSLFQFLWNLTIVGGFIKHYSYVMVPYILAENPAVKPGEALRLSKAMMYGHKWKAFLLDLSFAGWFLLGGLTMGILNIAFLNPYRSSVYALLYGKLRDEAKKSGLSGAEALNDQWLFEIPEEMKRAPGGEYSYPIGYFSIPEHKHRVWLRNDYTRHYSLTSLILLFFTFSFIGWLWEVSLHIVQDGIFVNRGVLYGPWLPIYGSGGVLILILLQRVRRRPILTFFLTVLICGVVEYGTSWFLEASKGMKWWDYSGYFLNLNGRICAEGLLIFGLGGCAFIYVLAPFFDELYKKIPSHRQMLLCILFLTAFAADFSYSRQHPNAGRGITDYDTVRLERESGQIRKGQPDEGVELYSPKRAGGKNA